MKQQTSETIAALEQLLNNPNEMKRLCNEYKIEDEAFQSGGGGSLNMVYSRILVAKASPDVRKSFKDIGCQTIGSIGFDDNSISEKHVGFEDGMPLVILAVFKEKGLSMSSDPSGITASKNAAVICGTPITSAVDPTTNQNVAYGVIGSTYESCLQCPFTKWVEGPVKMPRCFTQMKVVGVTAVYDQVNRVWFPRIVQFKAHGGAMNSLYNDLKNVSVSSGREGGITNTLVLVKSYEREYTYAGSKDSTSSATIIKHKVLDKNNLLGFTKEIKAFLTSTTINAQIDKYNNACALRDAKKQQADDIMWGQRIPDQYGYYTDYSRVSRRGFQGASQPNVPYTHGQQAYQQQTPPPYQQQTPPPQYQQQNSSPYTQQVRQGRLQPEQDNTGEINDAIFNTLDGDDELPF